MAKGKRLLCWRTEVGKLSEKDKRWRSRWATKLHCPRPTEHYGCLEVPVVPCCKHLGGYILRSGAKLPEVRVRQALAMQNLRPLRKFLTDPRVPLPKRQMLVRSMGMSVVLLHASTCFDLTIGEYKAWHAAVVGTHQTLQKKEANEANANAAMEANAAMPMELLYLHRIRLFLHILQKLHECLIAGILHNHHVARKGSWLYGLVKAVKRWQSQVGRECIPDEMLEFHEWECWHHFRDAIGELKKMLKKAEKFHLIQIKVFCAVKTQAKEQNDFMAEMGWVLEKEQEEDAVLDHQCEQCDSIIGCAPAEITRHAHSPEKIRSRRGLPMLPKAVPYTTTAPAAPSQGDGHRFLGLSHASLCAYD